mmetsp:Transcript_31072/g.100361  ORF Transcript_31072/g.100361 Transcript_31072/m.100361 type:complete len:296 (+) Transcript_31072:91-978(+)
MSRATLDWASGCAATSNPSTPLATSCPRSARRALSTKRGSPMASSGVPQKAASSVAETPGPISARVSGQQACLRSLRAAATSWSKAPGEMRCPPGRRRTGSPSSKSHNVMGHDELKGVEAAEKWSSGQGWRGTMDLRAQAWSPAGGGRAPPPRATMPAPGGPWCPASLARCSTSPQPQPPSTRRAPSRCATLTRASRFGAFPEGTSSPPAPSTNSSPPRARSASKLAARSPAPRSGPASPPLNWPPSAAPRSTPLGCRASSRAPAVPISGTRSRAGCSGSTLRRTRTPSPKWRAT